MVVVDQADSFDPIALLEALNRLWGYDGPLGWS